jgi:hypothetical protein
MSNIDSNNQPITLESLEKPLLSLEINNLKEDFGALQIIR